MSKIDTLKQIKSIIYHGLCIHVTPACFLLYIYSFGLDLRDMASILNEDISEEDRQFYFELFVKDRPWDVDYDEEILKELYRVNRNIFDLKKYYQ